MQSNDTLMERLQDCERRTRSQGRLLGVMVVLFVAIGSYVVLTAFSERIQTHEIVVLDDRGVERVRIGADLPDAVIDGKVVPRGEKAAGILLYDSTGQERSGYVTWESSGNVGLTLDSRKGQVALFVADPVEGSALRIWNANDIIEMRSDGDGSRLTAVRDGEVIFQEPPARLSAEACLAYRDALSRFSYEEVLKACMQRFSESACLECIGK